MIPGHFPLDHTAYVRQELEQRQKRRTQYSLRAFARDLEISPSFLCEFLAGRQGVSKARVAWIASKIGLSDEQSEHFWDTVQARFAQSTSVRNAAAFRAGQRAKSPDSHLSLERFHVIADWYHFALLEILGLPNAPRSLKEISRSLGVTITDLEGAIARLTRLELLEAVGEGEARTYRPTTQVTTVGEEVPSGAIQASHQQALRMHADQAAVKNYRDRENLSVSFSVLASEWPSLRKDVQKAVMEVVARYSGKDEPKDQVISLAMQMITWLEPEGANPLGPEARP